MNQYFKERYRDFVENKFGKFVVKALLSENLCLTFDPNKKHETGQEEVKNQLGKLTVEGLTKEVLGQNDTKWAFDFPSWIGSLTENGKEIMVIGMEPHIERWDFQATYGLFEFEGNFPHIGGNLWERLFALFGSPSETMTSRAFLERFYITDMCHFAILDKAKLTQGIKGWKSIRKEIADRFLGKEIELVKPRVVVTQGTFASNWLEWHLKEDKNIILRWKPTKNNPWREDTAPLEIPDAYKYLPRFVEYETRFGRLIHLALPHLGTGLTNTFWNKKNMKEHLRAEIEAFQKSS